MVKVMSHDQTLTNIMFFTVNDFFLVYLRSAERFQAWSVYLFKMPSRPKRLKFISIYCNIQERNRHGSTIVHFIFRKKQMVPVCNDDDDIMGLSILSA